MGLGKHGYTSTTISNKGSNTGGEEDRETFF